MRYYAITRAESVRESIISAWTRSNENRYNKLIGVP